MLGLGVTDPIPEQLQALCKPFPLEQTAAVTVVTVLSVALVAVWKTVLGAIWISRRLAAHCGDSSLG
jgi:hypothetical protein